MHRLEAEWLGAQMARLESRELFPLLNVGSSTHHYRTVEQPYIDSSIFQPLAKRGGKVWHADAKAAQGVDLIGDLLDPAFQAELARLAPRSVMVCNLFEHVTERQVICDFLLRLIPVGGYIIVTGPHDYPYHEDPIDTMFRPTVQEMAAHFDGCCEIVDGAIVDSGNWRQWNNYERGRSLPRTLVRLMLPFYRPRKWRELARRAWIFKHISAFGVVLRKTRKPEDSPPSDQAR
ncbi:MAG: methyltransferase type 11 [Gemmatimonadaceae bacterium]|nr:methyltransferase type 11 [Gemmatimonadaceae bacterium]